MRGGTESESVAEHAAAVPDRADWYDQATTWASVVLLLAATLALVAAEAREPADGAAAGAYLLLALPLGARAVSGARSALTMARGAGRFVFVDDGRRVPRTSGRWFRLWIWLLRPAGHWVHLTDAATEEPIGWVEVTWWSVGRVQAAGVAAVFQGSRPWSRSVLTGRFRPVPVVGRVRAHLPEDPGFGREAMFPSGWGLLRATGGGGRGTPADGPTRRQAVPGPRGTGEPG